MEELNWVSQRKSPEPSDSAAPAPQLAVEALEQSFDLLAPQMRTVVDNMYNRLFEISPRAAGFFQGVDTDRQRQSVVDTLQVLRNSLRHLDEIVPDLEALGARHGDWGVQEQDYAVMGPVLLEVMAAAADPHWKSEYTTAWAAAWEVVQGVMLQGAARAE
jgi:nitric oxide dioxygenase